MNIIPEIENPTFEDHDLFGLKPHAEHLTGLLTRLKHPSVLAVDAQWGSGKTVFLKQWHHMLTEQGHPAIYFDAFANDYMDDAFMAIAGEIFELLPTKEKSGIIKSALVNGGKVLLKGGVRAGVKAFTLGAIDTKEISDAGEAVIAGILSDGTDQILSDLLTTRKQDKDQLEALKVALSELPKILGAPDKPLIIMIDELDRCKPDFALELLERIKHVFNAPNVHFVLGCHKGQLENSIRAAYGAGIDAKRYLDKFIHINTILPSPRRNQKVDIEEFIKNTSKRIFNHDELTNGRSYIDATGFIEEMYQTGNYSLRDIERWIINLALCWPSGERFDPVLLSFMCLLKTRHMDLFELARNKSLSMTEIEPLFGLVDKEHPQYKNLKYQQNYREFVKVQFEGVHADTVTSLIRYSFTETFDGLLFSWIIAYFDPIIGAKE